MTDPAATMWRGDWRNEFWSGHDQPWDLIVVGGGIVGAGVLRLASKMGLRALLVEQRDFGWGTSSRSSKYVHGGLRYIKERQFHVVREAIRERDHLLRTSGGLVTPLGFLITQFQGDHPGSLTYRAGLMIYDLFSGRRDTRAYRTEQLRLLVPHLRAEGLRGGFRYLEGQTDDARLIMRVLAEATASGATAINYARVESLMIEDGHVTGVNLRDQIGEHRASIRARLVVNATGIWSDHLRGSLGHRPMIRPLRGSHLFIPWWRLPVAQAVNVNHPLDGRPVTIAPWEGATIVGCTDLPFDGSLNDEPAITPEEVGYLMGALAKGFPSLELTLDDVIATHAGVRPIVDAGDTNPTSMSRDARVEFDRGLLTVAGGKLTTYHSMALDALRAVPPAVLNMPLPEDLPPLDQIHVSLDLPQPQRSRLVSRYGNVAAQAVGAVMPGDLDEIPGTKTIWLELRWASQAEAVVHLDDLLLRRTRLGLLLANGGRSLLPRIRVTCQPVLGWDDERWQAEEERYLNIWSRYYSLPPRHLIPELPTS